MFLIIFGILRKTKISLLNNEKRDEVQKIAKTDDLTKNRQIKRKLMTPSRIDTARN